MDRNKSLSLERWNDAASEYETFSEPLTAQFVAAALDMIPTLKAGDHIVDIAAGTGALTMQAIERGLVVDAIDFSSAMVERLAKRVGSTSLANVHVMDGQALRFDDGAFDAAISIFGVMLFPDWMQGLTEMVRVVKSSGYVCVAVWSNANGAGPALPFFEAYRMAFPDCEVRGHSHGLNVLSNKTALIGALEDVGLSDVRTREVAGAWRVASRGWVLDNAARIYGRLEEFSALDPSDRSHFLTHLDQVLAGYEGEAGLAVPSLAHIAMGRCPVRP